MAGRDGFEPPNDRFGVRYIAVVVLLKTSIMACCLTTWLSPYILLHGAGLEPATHGTESISVRLLYISFSRYVL